MASQNTVQVSDLTEGEVDTEIGQKVLEEWENESKWLPTDFSDNASIESTQLIVCEREIEREMIATENTEELELSQSAYRNQKSKLQSEEAYRNRENSIPAGGNGKEVR